MNAVRDALGRVPAQLWVGYGLTLACLVLLALTAGGGLTLDRVLRILSNAAPLGIAVIAQTIVIINRGIDLSIGPVMNMAGIMVAAMASGEHLWGALPVVVLAGMGVGLVNGLILAYTSVPPLLGTLAMATIVQGGYSLITRGQPKGAVPSMLRELADGRVLGLPVSGSLLVFAVILICAGLFLRGTVAGRRFYATGANPDTAWLNGVPVRSHTLVAYTVSGALAAVAGIALIAYSGSPSLTAADSYALNSVVAAVIGGAALSGGTGGMAGALAGVSVMAFLTTVLNSFNVASPVQAIIYGCVLIAMLSVNGRIARSRGGRR